MIDTHRPLMPTAARSESLWPSERSARVDVPTLGKRFAFYRAARSASPTNSASTAFATVMSPSVEGGWDPLFVQQQVGHSHAATTGLYTWVGSDFRNKVLRDALDGTIAAALAETERWGGTL